MIRRYYNLPSLTTLAVFEAAARHLSFKNAARELNVTPGAVSHQIKALESELGLPLFIRHHRAVSLTTEGEELYTVLARGFGQAATTLERLRNKDAEPHVTISANTAFASMWLMSRISSFWIEHPDILINHRISDGAQDFRHSEVDIAIRYGTGRWPDEEARLLFHDEIFPVCSPRFAEGLGSPSARDIPGLPLIRIDHSDRDWTDWEEWLALAEIPHERLQGRIFNNYAIAIQAAEEGHGIALGWGRLVKTMLQQGRLQRLGDVSVPAPGAYYITWNSQRELSPQALMLSDWLIDAARSDG